MSQSDIKKYDEFTLPPTVVSRLDVSRLVGELEKIDNELTSDAIRHKSDEKHEVTKPLMSDKLNDFLHVNELELDDDHMRSELIKELKLL